MARRDDVGGGRTGCRARDTGAGGGSDALEASGGKGGSGGGGAKLGRLAGLSPKGLDARGGPSGGGMDASGAVAPGGAGATGAGVVFTAPGSFRWLVGWPVVGPPG